MSSLLEAWEKDRQSMGSRLSHQSTYDPLLPPSLPMAVQHGGEEPDKWSAPTGFDLDFVAVPATPVIRGTNRDQMVPTPDKRVGFARLNLSSERVDSLEPQGPRH